MQQHVIRKWALTSPTKPKYDPYEHAEELGIQVLFRPIRTANELWLPDSATIVIQESLRSVHRANALAHGIGHAALGHEDDRPKHEVQADRYAAENMIDGAELALLLPWMDSGRIANEIGVTTRLLRVYLNVHRLAG